MKDGGDPPPLLRPGLHGGGGGGGGDGGGGGGGGGVGGVGGAGLTLRVGEHGFDRGGLYPFPLYSITSALSPFSTVTLGIVIEFHLLFCSSLCHTSPCL